MDAPYLIGTAFNKEADMANVTRFDPFNELVDDLFKGFLVRPMYEGAQSAALPRVNRLRSGSFRGRKRS